MYNFNRIFSLQFYNKTYMKTTLSLIKKIAFVFVTLITISACRNSDNNDDSGTSSGSNDRTKNYITATTDLPIGSSVTITQLSSATKIGIDWGDGNIIDQNVDSNYQTVGTIKGAKLKIYLYDQNSIFLNKMGLTSIDLSNAPKLANLNLQNNKIASLDVTRLTELKLLWVANEAITNIDLSKNLKLENLLLRFNKLTKIDITKNTALTALDFANNISTIDLTKNTNLTKIDIEETSITSIDLSKNTQAKFIELHNAKLTAIDISKNVNLTYFGCVGNQISSIDLTKNINLEQVNLDGNKFTNVDLTKNPKIYFVNLSSNQIPSTAFGQIASSLPSLSKSYDTTGLFIDNATLATDAIKKALRAKNWNLFVNYKLVN